MLCTNMQGYWLGKRKLGNVPLFPRKGQRSISGHFQSAKNKKLPPTPTLSPESPPSLSSRQEPPPHPSPQNNPPPIKKLNHPAGEAPKTRSDRSPGRVPAATAAGLDHPRDPAAEAGLDGPGGRGVRDLLRVPEAGWGGGGGGGSSNCVRRILFSPVGLKGN